MNKLLLSTLVVSLLLLGCTSGKRSEPRDIPDPDTTSATDDVGGVIGCGVLIVVDSEHKCSPPKP
ncbi:hypothetical protein H4F20_08310 [Vibrio sp. 16]|uniref:hypothetical protein n=1 Tax=Vibrio sp. 16 TaxID=391586 RepID=UPI002FF2E341